MSTVIEEIHLIEAPDRVTAAMQIQEYLRGKLTDIRVISVQEVMWSGSEIVELTAAKIDWNQPRYVVKVAFNAETDTEHELARAWIHNAWIRYSGESQYLPLPWRDNDLIEDLEAGDEDVALAMLSDAEQLIKKVAESGASVTSFDDVVRRIDGYVKALRRRKK